MAVAVLDPVIVSIGPILVAIDGAPDCLESLAWAAAEADVRCTNLVILHVGSWSSGWDPMGVNSSSPYQFEARADAARLLAAAEDYARVVAPEVDVSTRLLSGNPARSIASAGRRSCLIVLGRGAGRSVTAQVTARSAVPVVVVGLNGRAVVGPSAGRVVAAVLPGQSPAAARAVLDTAIEAALQRDVGVTILAHQSPEVLARLRADAADRLDVQGRQFSLPLCSFLHGESQSAAMVVLATPAKRHGRAYSRSAVDLLVRSIVAPVTFVNVVTRDRRRRGGGVD